MRFLRSMAAIFMIVWLGTGTALPQGVAETDALALLPEDARDFIRGDVVVLWH